MADVLLAEIPITDVKNRPCFNKANLECAPSPCTAHFVRNSVLRWKKKHENTINKRAEKAWRTRRTRAKDKMTTRRRISLDLLAQEWLDTNPATIDVHAYLIENLFPSLIMGMEKLLTEAEKLDLITSENPVANFNPLNFLAQYLMRNNPLYSNFPEASPYARSLRKVADDLKKQILQMDLYRNSLIALKEEIHMKRMQRERMERLKGEELERRKQLLENISITCLPNEDTIPLAMVQSTLMSFRQNSKSTSDEIRREAYFAIKPLKLDTQGILLGVNEFKEVLSSATICLSNLAFEKFLEHFAHCANDFRLAADKDTIRRILEELFTSCDIDHVGALNRKRVLDVLVSYYDSSTSDVRRSLMDPQKLLMASHDEKDLGEESNRGGAVVSKTLESNGQKEEDAIKVNESTEKSNAEVNTSSEEVRTKVNDDGPVDVDSNVSDGSEKAEETIKVDDDLSEDSRSCSSSSTICKDFSKATCLRTTQLPLGTIMLDQPGFINLCELFLGNEVLRCVLDSFVRFTKASYRETDEERLERQAKARLQARMSKRKHMVEELFDFWDVDNSGSINFQDVIDVLSKWKDISSRTSFQNFMIENYTDTDELDCTELHEFIDSVCTSCFPNEDPFEAIVIFLHTSIERRLAEKKRAEVRMTWLNNIDMASKTSAGIIDPAYVATFHALMNDAQLHGRGKIISASIAFLEKNLDPEKRNSGETFLRYVAATLNHARYVLKKCLYRDMNCISFAAVDSGKPIHVSKLQNHIGVHLWNPDRKELGVQGSLIILPIKDREKRVTGVLSVDTINDSTDKSSFISHEISFYQSVAKSLSLATQFVEVRSKTIKIADSALQWIHRRVFGVQNSNFYIVEPGIGSTSEEQVLRLMFTINSDRKRKYYNDPARLYRKDNLFREYLFKCIESSKTVTADAYGERHLAFPILDPDGVAIAVVDISIGEAKALPSHEMEEVQKMLRLLAVAHREVTDEAAGRQKNIVLEVEKQNEDLRIEIMFDRLMLTDLRENVSRLDSRAYAELKSYKDPPKLVHDILKTVLGIFSIEEEEKLDNWPTCKQFINNDLIKMITQYDPTATSTLGVIDGKKLSDQLEGISPGSVSKQGSLPAQYLFNWAFVCLSLIEHTAKMKLVGNVQHPSKGGNITPSESSAMSSMGMT